MTAHADRDASEQPGIAWELEDGDPPIPYLPTQPSDSAEIARLRQLLERRTAALNRTLAKLARVERLAADGPFLRRWIDDSRLVDLEDLQRALDAGA